IGSCPVTTCSPRAPRGLTFFGPGLFDDSAQSHAVLPVAVGGIEVLEIETNGQVSGPDPAKDFHAASTSEAFEVVRVDARWIVVRGLRDGAGKLQLTDPEHGEALLDQVSITAKTTTTAVAYAPY